MTPTFRRVAMIAACFVLVVGIVFSVPALFEPDNDYVAPGYDNLKETVPPWERGENGLVSIKSIDMLNYYSAMKGLADSANTTMAVKKTSEGITLLSENAKSDAKTHGLTFLSNNDSSVGDDTLPDGSITETSKTDEEKIYYYELDSQEVFTISKAIFFQINVTDENGFLASKVGTGVVDVVITENSLEPMITFRNGNRFYSCLENGWSTNYRDFSTHKYVEGFCIVKNLEQENFLFYVSSNENEEVIGFECRSIGGSQKYRDEVCIIVSRTYTSNSVAAFTISDLEEYFNADKRSEGSDDGFAPETLPISDVPDVAATYYTDGLYVFELKINRIKDDEKGYWC